MWQTKLPEKDNMCLQYLIYGIIKGSSVSYGRLWYDGVCNYI